MVYQTNDFKKINLEERELKLSYLDLKKYVDLNWCIVTKCIELNILNEKAIQQYAIDLLSKDVDEKSIDTSICDDDLLDIAILTDSYSLTIKKLLNDKCLKEDTYLIQEAQYVLLKYLFESNISDADKLLLGEKVYVDFGYDSQLRIIFSYTSPPYPVLSDKSTKNVQKTLLNYWYDYLIENENYFKRK